MQLIPIETGTFDVDGGIMFGATAKSVWFQLYPSEPTNNIELSMRCILLLTQDQRRILIDTGVGSKHVKDAVSYVWHEPKHITTALREISISPDTITDVILTHLHFDHCGGCTNVNESGDYSLCFPNATHWVSESQWKNFLHPHPLEAESFFMDDMDLVSQSGKLQLISKPTDICKGVHLELFNGHTPGQIAVFIDTPSENAIIPGDVIPLCPSINPFIISAYDLTPLESYSSKLTLLDHAVQHHSKLYFYHDVCTQSSFVGKDSKAQYHPLPSPPT